jgi:dihydropyrimidinase
VKGWPVLVLSRGEVICEEGKVVAPIGRGVFLRCDLPPAAQARMPSALPEGVA